MRRPALSLFVSLFVLTILYSDASALWDEVGNLVGASNYNSYPLVMTGDGYGGAIICWKDESGPGAINLRIQKIDGHGNIRWSEDAVTIYETSFITSDFKIASDGAGGAIVVWTDWRNGTDHDVYAQRIDAFGNIEWSADGVVICDDSSNQTGPAIIDDGSGGAVIAWVDDRSGSGDIYAQHVDADGNVSWTANGIEVCDDTEDQSNVVITSDQEGGAIVAWLDYRTFGETWIYAQNVESDGSLGWTSVERPVSQFASTKTDLHIVPNDFGGSYIVWVDERGSDSDIYIQQLSDGGSRQLANDGDPLCVELEDQDELTIVADGDNGAIVFWEDFRDGTTTNIYAQKIDYNGVLWWTTNGVGVCTTGDDKRYLAPAGDGTGGAIVVWAEYRYASYDLFATRIDANGNLPWGSDGVPLVVTPDFQWSPSVVSDGEGGIITAFHDDRNHTVYQDIYAHRIDRFGNWGYPAPEIAASTDIPHDQGGFVSIDWDASRFDPWPYEEIDEYRVWRATDQESAKLLLSRSGGPDVDPRIRVEATAGGTFYWEHMHTIDATHFDHYSQVVETRFDSSMATTGYHYFQVSAHGVDPSEYWVSAADSCRSIDNLAPAPPMGVTGEQKYIPAGIELSWLRNEESDLSGYVVHRGFTPGFTPHPGNFVAMSFDTVVFDDDWDWSSGYWYKIGAIDIHDNIGEFALFAPGQITDGEIPSTPAAAYLGQNYPNPFNPSTIIRFGMPAAGHVSLRIYDTAGRLVNVVLDETRDAGHHTESWDGLNSRGIPVASGIYYYRLTTDDLDQTKKMILLR